MDKCLTVALVVENISKNMGGEAQKIFIYLQKLQEKGVSVWLVTHSRVKEELKEELSTEQFSKTRFVSDVKSQIFLHRISLFFPLRIRELIFGQIIYLISQIESRKIVQELIANQNIQLVFQPTPNTPFAPSALYDLGVPVVIGPLVGGMTFPPGFQLDSIFVKGVLNISRFLSSLLNTWMPGKLKAHEIIVANSRTKKLLPKGYKGRVHENIIESGVDLKAWQYFKKEFLERKTIRFVYTGRLVDWKGVNYLIDAFNKVSGRIDATLHIVGEGAEKQKLQEQTNILHLEEKIEFLGWMKRDNIIKYLLDCDVFIMPSIRESGGNSVLEAMALGLPVIVADWGGPGMFVDSTCGIKVKPTSPAEFVDGLADAMFRMAQSSKMRIAMSQNGRKRIIAQKYDWDSKIDYLIELFEECAQKYSDIQIH